MLLAILVNLSVLRLSQAAIAKALRNPLVIVQNFHPRLHSTIDR